MAKSTFEQLRDEYLDCINIISEIDYGNRSLVKKCNRTVDKMIRISKRINSDFHSRIHDFAELMTRNEFRIDAWVAHHILENMDYPNDLESKALEVITKYSMEDSPEGFGNRVWLEKWHERKMERK